MKKPKYSVTIREIYPYNFNRISNCEEVWYQGIEIHWSCDYVGYGVLTIDITKDGKYEFDTENMGLEFTKAVLKAYNSYYRKTYGTYLLLKKAKDYFAAGHSEAPAELEKLEKETKNNEN